MNIEESKFSYSCLICNNKNDLNELAIERKHMKHGSVAGFTICNDCIKQMSDELIEHQNTTKEGD